MSQAKKMLMVCYAFPPVGGAGVQRSVKFAKYLPDFGWTPTVLTVSNPSVPVLDSDLGQDLSQDITILRARTFEPSYGWKSQVAANPSRRPSFLKSVLRSTVMRFLQPDVQVLWNRNAYRAGANRLANERHRGIYVSGPPFSSFLLGTKLKKRFGLPLILDFRDEWSISAKYLENSSRQSSALKKQMSLFESTICQADAIVATTMASAEELQRCCTRVGSRAEVRCIYNGFDPDDLKALQTTQKSTEHFRLVYTGTLWKLTDIEPFVEAALLLSQHHPDEASKLELHFVGRRTQAQDAVLDRLATTPIHLKRLDYMPHQQSMQYAFSSDALLLTLADQPGAERVVPGKMFEYMALHRKILGLLPDGEANELLSKHPLATCIHPKDVRSIASWLAEEVAKRESDRHVPATSQQNNLDWCNRSQLTGKLVGLIEEIQRG